MLFSTHTAWTTCATLLESEGGLGLPAHAMPEADRQPTPIEHANLDKPLVQAPTPHTPSGRATRGNREEATPAHPSLTESDASTRVTPGG